MARTKQSGCRRGRRSGSSQSVLPGGQGETDYKTELQEFAQKCALLLPVYSTINYGLPLAPRFKSTVTVAGLAFVSPNAFNHIKVAEQDVARCALEVLTQKMLENKFFMLDLVPNYYKTILIEFAAKISVSKPTYSTKRADGIFISDVLFCEKTYTGRAKSDKEAERLAARAVIETILGNSSSRLDMAEIINSKIKFRIPLHQSPMISATTDGNFHIDYEDQKQTDDLGEFVHEFPETCRKKSRNNEEIQQRKQQLKEHCRLESQDSKQAEEV